MISMIEKTLTAIDIEYLEKRTKRVIDEFGIENLMDNVIIPHLKKRRRICA